MGCVSAVIKRVDSIPRVTITKDDNPFVSISRTASPSTTSVTYTKDISVSVTYIKIPINVSITHAESVNVNIELVCSASPLPGLEMWWCDGWSILWDNRLRILWQQD